MLLKISSEAYDNSVNIHVVRFRTQKQMPTPFHTFLRHSILSYAIPYPRESKRPVGEVFEGEAEPSMTFDLEHLDGYVGGFIEHLVGTKKSSC